MPESRIAIGNQTSRHTPDLMAPFAYAVERGFDAFEWFPDRDERGAGWDASRLDAAERARVRRTARERGIRLSVHAPCGFDVAGPDPAGNLAPTLELALDLGASVLNLHLYPERGLEAVASGLAAIVGALGEAASVLLSLENIPETGPADFNALFAALEARSPALYRRVGMCLDLGHANIFAATRNNYLLFVDSLQPHVPIRHLHLHENFGDADAHLTLFTGPSRLDSSGLRGFVARMRGRRFHGSIILEQWPDPPVLLDRARDGLRVLFEPV